MIKRVNVLDVSPGEILARLRREKKRTQQQLAEQIGLSRSMIVQVELGERQPSASLLAQIALHLQLSDFEQALLFFAFGKVQTHLTTYMHYMIAALWLDSRLPYDKCEELTALLLQAYTQESQKL